MKYSRVNITMPQSDIDEAKKKAEKYGVNLSALIRLALKTLPDNIRMTS